MTGKLLSSAFLLVTLAPGPRPLLGQQQPASAKPDRIGQLTQEALAQPESELPDAPQPVGTLPQQPASGPQQEPADRGAPVPRSAEGVLGRKQKSSNRAGFPPVSPPASGGMPVAPASRPNIFGQRAQCLPDSSSPAEKVMSCSPDIAIFARFLDSADPSALTPKQKFTLAAKNVADPFNLLTIGAVSGLSIASNAHSHYGPGFPGFAKNVGVSLTQDMTGEFFGTFLIPSIVHQDPHYHRMPNLSVGRRILHVIDEVVIAQSDQGTPMFNYATVVGTLCTSSLGNLYVPGRDHSFGASAARLAISFATDPIGNAITEFVPDLARHVNFQVVLVQRVINRVAIAEGAPPQ